MLASCGAKDDSARTSVDNADGVTVTEDGVSMTEKGNLESIPTAPPGIQNLRVDKHRIVAGLDQSPTGEHGYTLIWESAVGSQLLSGFEVINNGEVLDLAIVQSAEQMTHYSVDLGALTAGDHKVAVVAVYGDTRSDPVSLWVSHIPDHAAGPC